MPSQRCLTTAARLTLALCVCAGLSALTVSAGCASTAKDSASARGFNTVCPVSSEPINSPVTRTYKGETVAFCCDGCAKKFDSADAAAKAEIMNTAASKTPAINGMCPIGEDPITTADYHRVHQGKVIAFCCPGCSDKFDEGDAAFRNQVAAKAMTPEFIKQPAAR